MELDYVSYEVKIFCDRQTKSTFSPKSKPENMQILTLASVMAEACAVEKFFPKSSSLCTISRQSRSSLFEGKGEEVLTGLAYILLFYIVACCTSTSSVSLDNDIGTRMRESRKGKET